jgi:hypothetical protein
MVTLSAGKPRAARIYEELKDEVDHILNHHKPLPLDEDVEKELNKICRRAKYA